MGLWAFMLLMTLLIPVTMLAFGRYFVKNAPKDMHAVFGYRTAMSRKNRDTWEFAHHYCGRAWCVCGAVMLPLSVLPMLFVMDAGKDVVGTFGYLIYAIQLVVFIGSILPVERALKKTFDSAGRRR